eukprot:5874045-Pyramimonas_sp.AAC.1
MDALVEVVEAFCDLGAEGRDGSLHSLDTGHDLPSGVVNVCSQLSTVRLRQRTSRRTKCTITASD